MHVTPMWALQSRVTHTVLGGAVYRVCKRDVRIPTQTRLLAMPTQTASVQSTVSQQQAPRVPG